LKSHEWGVFDKKSSSNTPLKMVFIVQIPPINRFPEMISFYFDFFENFKKARKTEKNGENPRKSRVFGAISFLVALIGCAGRT